MLSPDFTDNDHSRVSDPGPSCFNDTSHPCMNVIFFAQVDWFLHNLHMSNLLFIFLWRDLT